ncbi:hypothetical protein [Photobacterium damselae]|uniref:hypothetical protein n=1 Tax=Photobacterium damselae TaxID=38293 RepID=UPI001F28301B|nr:hypothetical protein [Photobacterium damselae]UKA04955.1 hypothetical protein IHC89_22175 [Photobacterium damselae subsp. damselae]
MMSKPSKPVVIGLVGAGSIELVRVARAATNTKTKICLPRSRESVSNVGMIGGLAGDLVISSRVMERNGGSSQNPNNLCDEMRRAAFMCKSAQLTTVHREARYISNKGAESERLAKELVEDLSVLHNEHVERENCALETFDNEDSNKQ